MGGDHPVEWDHPVEHHAQLARRDELEQLAHVLGPLGRGAGPDVAPAPDQTWRVAMRTRAASARAVLVAHPWALGLLESRRHPGPALLRHHDAVLGCLRGAGFPVELAAHAYSVLDAYVYGFVLTELNLPMEAGEDAQEFAAGLALAADDYPHLVEMMAVQLSGGTYDYADEFDYGLDLVLDGLEERLSATARVDG